MHWYAEDELLLIEDELNQNGAIMKAKTYKQIAHEQARDMEVYTVASEETVRHLQLEIAYLRTVLREGASGPCAKDCGLKTCEIFGCANDRHPVKEVTK